MRRSCLGIAGALLAFTLAGCGETKEEGPVGYKASDSPAIQKLRDGMSDNMKNKSKGTEDKSAAKKDAEKKPSGDATPDKKK